MESKILIVLAVIGAILLFGLITPPPVTERGELIDTGHFVLEQGGVPIIEENYTLFFSMEEGYMLLSEASLSSGDQTITLAQQYQLDQDFTPVLYHLAADTPSGSQLISAQMGTKGLHMDVLIGSAHQSVDIPDNRNTIILDNNLISHYVVLLIAAETRSIDRDFTAVIPQALLALPAHLDGPNTTEFTSGETRYTGKLYELRLGDLKLSLIAHEGRLVGLFNPSQGTRAYNADLFPGGISLETSTQETRSLPVGVTEQEVTFANKGIVLAGTITLPDGTTEPVPGALFIHGSGPVDRDGNAIDPASGSIVMAMDAYRQLAHALAEVGIASLRFDKRGVGLSDGDTASASRTDLLSDVRAAVGALRTQQEVDPKRAFLIGHSEGAYLAPVIAAEDESVAGIILLAGAARSLDEITRWQVEANLRQQGATEKQIAEALKQEDQYLEFVKTSTGEWEDHTLAELQEAMPWLTEDAAAQLVATPLSLSWLREHYLDDPASTIRQVACPVLVINGEKDLQIPASEAEGIKTILEEAENKDITVVVLPDLNHLLRHHPEEPNLTYRHLDDPVDPRVIEIITGWISEHSAR